MQHTQLPTLPTLLLPLLPCLLDLTRLTCLILPVLTLAPDLAIVHTPVHDHDLDPDHAHVAADPIPHHHPPPTTGVENDDDVHIVMVPAVLAPLPPMAVTTLPIARRCLATTPALQGQGHALIRGQGHAPSQGHRNDFARSLGFVIGSPPQFLLITIPQRWRQRPRSRS